MSEFEKFLLVCINSINDKIGKIDNELKAINRKLNNNEEYLPISTDLKVDTVQCNEQLRKLEFEIELLKKHLRS